MSRPTNRPCSGCETVYDRSTYTRCPGCETRADEPRIAVYAPLESLHDAVQRRLFDNEGSRIDELVADRGEVRWR